MQKHAIMSTCAIKIVTKKFKLKKVKIFFLKKLFSERFNIDIPPPPPYNRSLRELTKH